MTRPVTLFTGQWADLPVADLAAACAGWGFDGLELACWGDHFEVDRALADDAYCGAQKESSSGTGSGAGRSARTSSARPCATASTRGISRSCRPTCGAMARRKA